MNPLTSRALAALAVTAIALVSVAGPAGGAPGDDKTNVPLRWFAGGEEIDGTFSSLTRTEDGIVSKIRTHDVPGNAYTVWYVIFNDPTQCSGGVCNADDIFNNGVNAGDGFNAEQIADARISVVWANAGDVANAAGRLKLDGGLAEGEVPQGSRAVVIGLPADNPLAPAAATGAVVTGLEDASAAEVHVVVQSHGAAHDDHDLLAAQLSGFNAACNPSCVDTQFAVHQP